MGRKARAALLGAGAVAIVAGSFVTTLKAIDYFMAPRCPAGQTVTLARPFKHQEGHAYMLVGPFFQGVADTDQLPKRSPVVVCEDGHRLDPPYSLVADIAKLGMGRFNHYMGAIFFSASDNSDPNTNGRTYSIVLPNG